MFADTLDEKAGFFDILHRIIAVTIGGYSNCVQLEKTRRK